MAIGSTIWSMHHPPLEGAEQAKPFLAKANSQTEWFDDLLNGIVGAELEGRSKVRVRVFPHFRNYMPHRRDLNKDAVEVTSAQRCVHAHLDLFKPGKLQVIRSFVPGELQKFHLKSFVGSVYVACEGPVTVIRNARSRKTYAGFLQVNAVEDPARGNHIEVVNHVGVEDYLKGVLPAEVYPFWPKEALKSQAVAARTYLGYHLDRARKRTHRRYDVDDTIRYQAYTGLDDRTRQTDAAVEATRSEVITFRGKIAQALYHADSGGVTEDASTIFGRAIPYCVGKKEPYDQGLISSSQWSYSVPMKKFERRLRRNRLLKASEHFAEIQPQKFSPGGRILSLVLKTKGGEERVFSSRRLLKMFPLKSAKFMIQSTGDGISFSGRGSGHGVGLSQKGAKVLAEKLGWTYRKILSHYYTGTKLCRIGKGLEPLQVVSCGV